MIQITPQMKKCGAPHFFIYVKSPVMWSIDHGSRWAMTLGSPGFT
jgi:hypothetical protein